MKAPARLGKYLLLERMNVGSIAEVFVAKALGVEGFERIVALKKILPGVAADQEFISMFLDEARISVQLNHANIAHVLEFGKHQDTHFIAMEYVSGRDLRRVLDYYVHRNERMPVAQAAFIASRICEGLDYAHRRKDPRGVDLNIVHRGVSPQNVLLSFEGELKLIDFGMAKAANRSQKTQVGILKGKAGYMSPEQIRARPLDRRSDLFAVGVILYEALSGSQLFIADSDFATLENVSKAEIPALRDRNPYVPDGLEEVVLKALARDPDQRYQWASDLQDDLARYLVNAEAIYSAKNLAAFMREAFSDDLRIESDKLSRFAQQESAAPADADSDDAKEQRPPRAAVKPRVQISAFAPFEMDSGDTQITVDKTVVQTLPELDDSLDEALGELAPGEVTQVVSIQSMAPPTGATAEPSVIVQPTARRGAPSVSDRPKSARQVPTLVAKNGQAIRRTPSRPDLDFNDTTNPELDRAKLLADPQPKPAPRPTARATPDGAGPKRSGPSPWLIGVAATAVVGLVMGGLLILKGRDPGSGILVKVMPIGAHAQVTVGGRLVTSDRVMRFPPGEYDLVAVAPGYRMQTQRITIWRDDPEAVFTVFLEPEASNTQPKTSETSNTEHEAPKPARFSATFLGSEPGIEVSVDGRNIGRTPNASASGLEVGKAYHFVAKRSGFKSQEGQFSSDGQPEIKIPLSLEREPSPEPVRHVQAKSSSNAKPAQKKGRGKLVCSSTPPGAEIFVDGKSIGRRTPVVAANPIDIPIGKRKIVFRIGGFESAVQVVDVRDNETSSLTNVVIDREHDLF